MIIRIRREESIHGCVKKEKRKKKEKETERMRNVRIADRGNSYAISGRSEEVWRISRLAADHASVTAARRARVEARASARHHGAKITSEHVTWHLGRDLPLRDARPRDFAAAKREYISSGERTIVPISFVPPSKPALNVDEHREPMPTNRPCHSMIHRGPANSLISYDHKNTLFDRSV